MVLAAGDRVALGLPASGLHRDGLRVRHGLTHVVGHLFLASLPDRLAHRVVPGLGLPDRLANGVVDLLLAGLPYRLAHGVSAGLGLPDRLAHGVVDLLLAGLPNRLVHGVGAGLGFPNRLAHGVSAGLGFPDRLAHGVVAGLGLPDRFANGVVDLLLAGLPYRLAHGVSAGLGLPDRLAHGVVDFFLTGFRHVFRVVDRLLKRHAVVDGAVARLAHLVHHDRSLGAIDRAVLGRLASAGLVGTAVARRASARRVGLAAGKGRHNGSQQRHTKQSVHLWVASSSSLDGIGELVKTGRFRPYFIRETQAASLSCNTQILLSLNFS